MPDNSVDSVVTDPPYGLSFMGKKWDYDVPSEEIWRECLRVLKPGGHLLAFAGTRTQHRMAVRIEDAGFEIRDMIAWVYSTGFPKSHNFGCKCSRDALPYSHEKAIQSKQATECKMHPLRDSNVSPSLDIGEGRGEVLQPCLSQSGASIEGREQLSTSKVRGGESSMEGRRDLLAETRELQADQVCPVSGGVSAYGSEGRLHNGASSDNGADNGAVPIEDRSRASCEPRPAGQPTGESGVIPKQRGAQERGVEADQVCAKCGKLAEWQGWGTALKPALEPITVARKPLGEKTVAANVLAHGTGGINVDGCRVGTDGGTRKSSPPSYKTGTSLAGSVDGSLNGGGCEPINAGRWPSNLIHDGSDEVVELFPVTTSGKPMNKMHTDPGRNVASGASEGGEYFHTGYGDTGSAARFFYCAKASKKDREGSTHPTMKPTALMRYLCRLVTPPEGIVLDPFMGSGSTGKAAMLEGFQFIGIERDEEYMRIAKNRISAAIQSSDNANIKKLSTDTTSEERKAKTVDRFRLAALKSLEILGNYQSLMTDKERRAASYLCNTSPIDWSVEDMNLVISSNHRINNPIHPLGM